MENDEYLRFIGPPLLDICSVSGERQETEMEVKRALVTICTHEEAACGKLYKLRRHRQKRLREKRLGDNHGEHGVRYI